MSGGLLNLIAIGNNNVFLTGNPTKTFFKVVYSKFTNFGLQKFRIDYEGSRELRSTSPSQFTFKIPRNADLLMDTYLSIFIPDIWSPVYHPCEKTGNVWSPYEFHWIRDLGVQMIQEVLITCGSQIIQKFSGQYLHAMIQRDFNKDKRDLLDRMSGNLPEYNDPGNTETRKNTYPSAFYSTAPNGAEPSIRGRNIYIPINTWFTLDSRCAFPLVSLQYNELYITITLRPIQDLFQVRDVFDPSNNFPLIKPDFTQDHFSMYRFLQTPPNNKLDQELYPKQFNTWNTDIHLIATYAFLAEEERKLFAAEDQVYLVKDVFEYNFYDVAGASRVNLTSNGMVSSWMWFFQRSDANQRNEWSNYTNWAYRNIPYDIKLAMNYLDVKRQIIGPGRNPNGRSTGIFITGDFNQLNQKDILQTFGILLNGDYRENLLPRGIFDYIEKYVRTAGSAPDGLYCYNFCLNTNPFKYQPSGALNMSKFKDIQLEFSTMIPVVGYGNALFTVFCDDKTKQITGVSKPNAYIYAYNYNLTLLEERYNILSFIGGNAAMLYAR